MPVILTTVSQQHLLNKFLVVKAYFFINVAATINCVPEQTMKPVGHGVMNEKSKPNLPNLKGNDLFYFCLFLFLFPLLEFEFSG